MAELPEGPIPKQGEFYDHWKRDPEGSLENHTYLVLGLGKDEETGVYRVFYRAVDRIEHIKDTDHPLWWCRRLEMFTGYVDDGGRQVPRFTKVTDSLRIFRLMDIADSLRKPLTK